MRALSQELMAANWKFVAGARHCHSLALHSTIEFSVDNSDGNGEQDHQTLSCCRLSCNFEVIDLGSRSNTACAIFEAVEFLSVV